MAAEKLTRGRFVQIIIMLTLLIAVFIWRTVTFTETTIIECNLKPNCAFSVKNEAFSAEIVEGNVLVKKPSEKWILTPQNSEVQITESDSSWVISPGENNEFEITISDLEQANLAGVKFRI